MGICLFGGAHDQVSSSLQIDLYLGVLAGSANFSLTRFRRISLSGVLLYDTHEYQLYIDK